MKKVIFIIFISMFNFSIYGQACGIYRIRYNLKIESPLKIKTIKLPTIRFLHNLDKDYSKSNFIELKGFNNKFEIEEISHLTSNLFSNPENLKNYYNGKREFLPIVLIVNNKEKVINVSWKDVIIVKINDNGFGNLFEIKINEIVLNN